MNVHGAGEFGRWAGSVMQSGSTMEVGWPGNSFPIFQILFQLLQDAPSSKIQNTIFLISKKSQI
jgi:hypothetical protein